MFDKRDSASGGDVFNVKNYMDEDSSSFDTISTATTKTSYIQKIPTLSIPQNQNYMTSAIGSTDDAESDKDLPTDADTWINLTTSLKNYYEKQIEILDNRTNDLNRDKEELTLALRAANKKLNELQTSSSTSLSKIKNVLLVSINSQYLLF